MYKNLTFDEILEIINTARYCNLAVLDETNQPYVIPMNFKYKQNIENSQTLIFEMYSNDKGMKMNAMNTNQKVALEFTKECCDTIYSIVIFGIVTIIKEESNSCNMVKILITSTNITGRKYYMSYCNNIK